MVTEYIGKEANRWEDQYHLGLDPNLQTEYGLSPGGRERVLKAARGRGQRRLSAGFRPCSSASAILAPRPSPSYAWQYPTCKEQRGRKSSKRRACSTK